MPSLRSFVADIEPLKVSPDFRRLWFGVSIGQLGQQMTTVAMAIQVYAITGSTFSVGLVGIFSLVPLIGFGLYGGAIADAFDRRLVGLTASIGLWALSLALFVQALLRLDNVWVLYLIVALQSACFAVNNPARQAMIPRLIPLRLLPAASALNTLTFNLGFSLGPLLGAALISVGGFEAAYGVDAVLFLAALYALWRLPAFPPERDAPKVGARSVLEGLRFLRTRPNVLMTFLVDLAAMVLAQPRAIFPELAQTTYGGGVRTVGLLQAAPAVGAMVMAVSSGWLGRIHRQGLAVLICVIGYGTSVALFGLSPWLWLALLFLALTGAFDMVSAAYRQTILLTATPDALRGRLQGVFIVVVAGGPRLGDFVAGSVRSLTTPTFAIVAGGCACVGVTLYLAARHRAFAAYDARHPTP